MSAVKDFLISECERLEAAGFGAFDDLMACMLDTVPTGYICKQCGGPSPVGVGYAAEPVEHTAAVLAITSCPCGYSRTAVAL